MNKAFIGIDPGKNGGIAIVDDKGDLIYTATIPLIGKEIDLNALWKIFQHFKNFGESQHIIMERVHGMFGSSSSATFTFGQVNGFIEAFIVAGNYKYTKVNPAAWQKISWEGIKIPTLTVTKFKTDKLSGVKVSNGNREKVLTKEASLLAAKRLFPSWNFTKSSKAKKDHDGLIDAALLAYYGYCKFK